MAAHSRERSRTIDPELLIQAYAIGLFPMADAETGEISWFSPDPRAILELSEIRISRSLAQSLRHGRYALSFDTEFEKVIRACQRPETWISEDIVQSYLELHRLGLAHSVECRLDTALVGGLYGVALGGAFFGESMFSTERDASKVSLVGLVRQLERQGYELLDVQFLTPHLVSLGAREIPRSRYLERLARALEKPCTFA